MSFSVIITLTYGSEAGPFDLYSDVDGYVTPFESNIPAGSFDYGYYTTNVPDGTTIIKVKSDGECINFVDLSIQNLPTPTPSITPTQTATPTQTGTPSVTSTPTQTQTQTQTPSSTIGSTPTQTPSPTPTMTAFTGPCVCVEMTATNTDPEGPAGSIEYNNCFGVLVAEIFNTTGTRYRCVDYTGGVIQVFSSTNVTYGVAAGYSCSMGTCPTDIVIPLTPTPTQTQTQTATPSSTLGSTPPVTPTQTATPTQTGTPSVSTTPTQTQTQTQTQSPTPSPTLTATTANLDITNGSLDIQITDVYVNGVLTSVTGGSLPNTTGNGTNLSTTQVGTYTVDVYYNTGTAGQHITLTDSDLFSTCINTITGSNIATFTSVKVATYTNVIIDAQDGTCI